MPSGNKILTHDIDAIKLEKNQFTLSHEVASSFNQVYLIISSKNPNHNHHFKKNSEQKNML